MDTKPDPQTWKTVTIAVAVIGCIGILGAALIGVLPEFLRLTPTLEPAQSPTIALSDNFDGKSGSYDTSLWTCANEYNIENIFLSDGIMYLQKHDKGDAWTAIISRSKWAFSDISSLVGKFQISRNLNQGEVGWLSFNENIIGCGVFGTETPYIKCDAGPNTEEGTREYNTNEISINFDTWYLLEYKFDQNSNSIGFYLDNTLMGKYTFAEDPATIQVSIGIYSPDTITSSGQFYIDDVTVTLNK